MPRYARILTVDGIMVVAELVTTIGPIEGRFHPSLHWQDVTDMPAREGWTANAGGPFKPPLTSVVAATSDPSAMTENGP